MDHFAMLTPHEQLVKAVLHKVAVFRNVLSRICGPPCWPLAIRNWSRSRSRKESEVFGWSRIPKIVTSRSRILYPTLTAEPNLNHFIQCTLKLGILSRACWNGTILLKFLLKLRILVVYYDFQWC